jgi:hypothetical protein
MRAAESWGVPFASAFTALKHDIHVMCGLGMHVLCLFKGMVSRLHASGVLDELRLYGFIHCGLRKCTENLVV